MKNIFKILICGFMALTLVSPALALTVDEFDDKPTKKRNVPIPAETIEHWNLASHYKFNRRYELARQHLLLALTTCNTTELRDELQRELQIVDLQIRTLR